MEKKNFIDKLNEALVNMQNIKVKDKLIFYRLLATMTNAWMTLVKSIKVLEEQEKNLVLKNILGVFIKELKWGKTLSECLELYPNSFDDSEVWIISSGEKTWKLNTILLDLAEQLEKISSISWKLKSAMIYPSFIILVVFWVIWIMMVVIVPKLLEIFTDKSALPASTKVLIAISDFLAAYWWLLIIGIIGFVIAVKIMEKNTRLKIFIWLFYAKITYLLMNDTKINIV